MLLRLFTGFLLGALIGAAAWRARSLNASGALAAAVSGGLIFGLGGPPWAALLLAFFVSSSALSHAFAGRKAALNEKFAKGGQRDWGQVLANGGLGALLAIAHAAQPGQAWPWLAFAGAMAAVNADTWATELGVLSRGAPRLVTTGAPVERGESGGVTLTGYLAASGGAAFIALTAAVFDPGSRSLLLAGGILLAGLVGSTFDSLLGATVQAIYFCPACQKATERHPRHTCGSETVPSRGWRWLSNDLVNFACSLAGALVAAGLGLLL